MLSVRIETIPHNQQRYPTLGDWMLASDDSADFVIRVSNMGDSRKELLIAVHELVEAFLCREAGITQHEVDLFDIDFEAQARTGEPGDCRDAPYYHEHQFAQVVEMALCERLGMNWNEYNKSLEHFFDEETKGK